MSMTAFRPQSSPIQPTGLRFEPAAVRVTVRDLRTNALRELAGWWVDARGRAIFAVLLMPIPVPMDRLAEEDRHNG